MTRKLRERVYVKCGGHCAYCGREITMKEMQGDHLTPLYRNDTADALAMDGIKKGTDDFSNLMPSCRACNFRKGTLPVEKFRQEIRSQCDRAIERSFQVRMSLAYGLLEHHDHEIKFYFEKLEER